MAKAMIIDTLSNARTLKLAHTAAVEEDDIVVSNGQVLVAAAKADADALNAYVYRGKVSVPKEAALAVNPGDVLYWVAAAGNANKTASGNAKMGICVEPAAGADTTVTVMLDENK